MPNSKEYRERLIEKLEQLVKLHGNDSPFAEELARLQQQPAGGVSVENTEKGDTENPKKKKE